MLLKSATVLLILGLFSAANATEVLNAGFGHVPPISYRAPDGRPAGFAIDVLNEAARREGLRLDWRPTDGSADIEQRLERGDLDLVPAALVTPERRRKFFVSEPWWSAGLTVLTRASGPRSAAGLRGLRMALASPVYHFLVERNFPGVVEVPERGAADAGAAVCSGRADVALMTHTDATEITMMRPAACRGMDLASFESDATMELAIMSGHSKQGAARRLRRRVDQMAIDGTLESLALRNPPIPTSGAVRLAAELREQFSRRVWRILLSTAILLLGICAWAIMKLRRDVAARKRAQAELERSEERLARSHRIASMGHWEIHAASGEITWSDAARQIAAGADGGRGWQALLTRVQPDDVERVRAAFEETIAGGKPLKIEYGVIAPDGTRRFVRQHAEAVKDAQGNVATILGTIQDVSDYRELEEQFWQAQKLETVGLLAGGIAHDFNNLLTVINGYSDMAISTLPEDDPMKGYVGEIRKAGERAAALTAQLLTFSRRQPAKLAPLDLNSVVRDAGKMLNRLVGERIQIRTALQPVPAINADVGQMHQLLMNLVVNARDAMPTGGTIVIATSEMAIGSEAGQRDGGPAPAGSYVRLTVTDTGIGMDEKTKTRIFEPFFTTKPKGAGTGLGLSTVYGIVKQGDGWISVESEPGKGSSFHVFFRSTGESSGRLEAGNTDTHSARGSETILVVEDQDDVRDLTVNILRKFGYRVLDVRSGEEAMAVLRDPTRQVDLVMTDIVMPGMTGTELVKLARLERPGIAALFVSGYTESVQELHDSGVPYLAKPYGPKGLAAAVRGVLDTTRGQDRHDTRDRAPSRTPLA